LLGPRTAPRLVHCSIDIRSPYVSARFAVPVRIAGPTETHFDALLHADSDHALPDSDDDFIAAFCAYGAILKKGESHASVELRLNLLSGLRWLHSIHAHDLALALSTAPLGHCSPPRLPQGWQDHYLASVALAPDPGQRRAGLDSTQAQDPRTHSGRPNQSSRCCSPASRQQQEPLLPRDSLQGGQTTCG
jgi:hypothetical protein